LHRPGEAVETVPEGDLKLLECAVERLEQGTRAGSKTA